jgi:hypothetical protein
LPGTDATLTVFDAQINSKGSGVNTAQLSHKPAPWRALRSLAQAKASCQNGGA